MKKIALIIGMILCSIVGFSQPKYLGWYRTDIVKNDVSMKFTKNQDGVLFCKIEDENLIKIYFINTYDRCDCICFIFKNKNSFVEFFNKLKASYKKPYPSENLWIIDDSIICRVYLDDDLPVVYYLTN